MPMVPKHEIATELLDRALRLYFEGDSYYAALHLAGAAEEVLSVYVRQLKDKHGNPLVPAFDSLKEAAIFLASHDDQRPQKLIERSMSDLMNDAKNGTKHRRGKGDDFAHFDAKAEAKQLLDFAVSNYYQLSSALDLPHTPLLEQFNAELRGA